MTRFVSLLLPLLGAGLLAGCVVGQGPEKPDTGDRTVCEERAAAVLPAYSHVGMPTGTRAQMACMDAGCHSAVGGTARAFAFAGTVYKETSAVTPVGGVTVRIFKKGGTQSLAEAITNDAGNFVIDNPATFTEFPYETHVTGCGVSMEIRPMAGPIPIESANCNTGGGCHGPGGSQGAIFLAD
jgi:hypothetical protein